MKNTKWYMLVVVLLLGAFTLAACGGGQEATPTQAPAPTEEAAPEPTDEPAPEPTDEPAPEPTEVPATEAPAETTLAGDTSMTMLELLATDPNYSKFVEAMTAAGIAEPTQPAFCSPGRTA